MLLVSTCSSVIGGPPIIPAGAGPIVLKGTSGSYYILFEKWSKAFAAFNINLPYFWQFQIYLRLRVYQEQNVFLSPLAVDSNMLFSIRLCRIDLQQSNQLLICYIYFLKLNLMPFFSSMALRPLILYYQDMARKLYNLMFPVVDNCLLILNFGTIPFF